MFGSSFWPSSIALMLQACSTAGGPHGPYWAWAQPYYTQALHCLLQQGQMLASLPPDTIKNMAVTYFIKAGGLETTVWVGQLLTWIQQHASGAPQGAGTGQEAAGSSAGPMPPMADFQGDVLNLQVHPLLQPYLDLLPSTGPQAALQRFLHVQVGIAAAPLPPCLLLRRASSLTNPSPTHTCAFPVCRSNRRA
jgi:hypothetical protein